MAIAIAKAESGLRCNAINQNKNKTYDYSIFQINSIHGKYENCIENIKKAKEIRDAWGNWKAWSAYNNKSYLKFY